MNIDRFKMCESTVAKLLGGGNFTYVTVRWVVNASMLSQSQARTQLRKMVAMGLLTERRIPSLGNGYVPTDLGNMSFSAVRAIDQACGLK